MTMDIYLQNEFTSAILSTEGAELKSLKDRNQNEYIWSGDPAYWGHHSPLLFPIVSNTRNNKIGIKGQEYEMPPHGFVRQMEWIVASQTPSSVKLAVHETNETKSHYPYQFLLSVQYKLTEIGIRMEFEVHNENDETMPYCLGAHPGICVPFAKSFDSRFEDYRLIFDHTESKLCPIYNRKTRQIDWDHREIFLTNEQTFSLDYDLFERVDTVLFDDLQSRKLTLLDTKTKQQVIVQFENFSDLAIWSPRKSAPFLCIEPWQGLSVCSTENNQMEEKHGVQILQPHTVGIHSLEINIR